MLQHLRDCHAFDPTPKFDDVGAYHVPFESMSVGTHVEGRLRDGALRGERIALIADSGCGKTSLVSHVLGPTAESVAPILVPVHSLELGATKAEHVADMILSQLARQAREAGLAETATSDAVGLKRSLTRVSRRITSVGARIPGWMAHADIAKQIENQISTTEPITLMDKREVIYQCLQPIYGDSLMPVFVFDDTDRWTAASEEEIIAGFFGEAIRWLSELDVSVVVATHTRYLESSLGAPDLLAFLDTRVEIPRVPSAKQLGCILNRRVQVHKDVVRGKAQTWRLEDIVNSSAVQELYRQYEQGSSLRKVLQLAHMALVETVDANAESITVRDIRAAVQA